ncbi:hypothetical protein [Paraburkholderia youngii]|nr:hypothetical protein [Paraburkholderia youngii]
MNALDNESDYDSAEVLWGGPPEVFCRLGSDDAERDRTLSYQ